MGDSITRFVREWQDGSVPASFELDRLLRSELLALVRSHRGEQFRARIDSEAVVNAALKSFLSGALKNEFPLLRDRSDVKRLLTRVAICVLRDQVRAERTQKRDLGRVASAPSAPLANTIDAAQPTPQECAEAREYWEKFPEVVRVVHPSAMTILELTLEGLTTSQIAAELGLGVRSVQVIIQKMLAAWQKWVAAEDRDEPPPSAELGGSASDRR